MKETIEKEEIKQFGKDSTIFTVLLGLSVVSPVPLMKWFWPWGIGVLVIIYALTTYYAFKIEKTKKQFDIQTMKEIVAFTEGKRLPSDESLMEKGKRPYQKILLALGSAVITTVVAIVLLYLIK